MAGPRPTCKPTICTLPALLLLALYITAPVQTVVALATAQLEAQETGVWHCSMVMQTAAVPGLSRKTEVDRFLWHVALRYTSVALDGQKNFISIQGFNVADVPEPAATVRARKWLAKHADFDPPAHEAEPQLLLRPLAAPQNHSGISLSTTLSFPLGPVVSGMPKYIATSFTIAAAWGHAYTLTAFGGGEGRTCTFEPTAVSNRLDSRGINVDVEAARRDNRSMPSEAVVIVKPLFNMQPNLSAALIDRHLQHYAMIGFTKYILYVLPGDIQALVNEPRISKWLQHGMLSLIKWDAVPVHPGNPLWDQRVVYSHAVLAFLGRPTFLLMADLDEFMVSLQPDAVSVFDMVQRCTQPSEALVNLQLTRYHVIAKDWPDRTRSEQALWIPDTREEHPIMRNSLINLKYPPYFKSMVNPNFIKVFFIHVASAQHPHNITRPDPQCMMLAHACNVNYGRTDDVAKRFAESLPWQTALERLRQQRTAWLGAGSTAARIVGPA